MCEQKEAVKSKLDRLIEAIDRLADLLALTLANAREPLPPTSR